MRVSWDEDSKSFIVTPTLDDLEEVAQLGRKRDMPDVALMALIIHEGLIIVHDH